MIVDGWKEVFKGISFPSVPAAFKEEKNSFLMNWAQIDVSGSLKPRDILWLQCHASRHTEHTTIAACDTGCRQVHACSQCAEVLAQLVREYRLSGEIISQVNHSPVWMRSITACSCLFFFKKQKQIFTPWPHLEKGRRCSANACSSHCVYCVVAVKQRGHIRLHRPQQSQRQETQRTCRRLFLRLHNCCYPSHHPNPVRGLVWRWLWQRLCTNELSTRTIHLRLLEEGKWLVKPASSSLGDGLNHCEPDILRKLSCKPEELQV